MTFKWQLSDDQNLVPQTYNNSYKYDPDLDQILPANIESDYLTYYKDIRVKETFQIGFGELCYIPDQMIKPINDMIKNKRAKLPIAAQRLVNSLPNDLLAKYFPKFAANNANFFDHLFPDVGNCPLNRCEPMPIALSYNSTANGRRVLANFRDDVNTDETGDIYRSENSYYKFMNDLNNNHYCSPYV